MTIPLKVAVIQKLLKRNIRVFLLIRLHRPSEVAFRRVINEIAADGDWISISYWMWPDGAPLSTDYVGTKRFHTAQLDEADLAVTQRDGREITWQLTIDPPGVSG